MSKKFIKNPKRRVHKKYTDMWMFEKLKVHLIKLDLELNV